MAGVGRSPLDEPHRIQKPLILQTLMGAVLDPIALEAYLGSFAVLSS